MSKAELRFLSGGAAGGSDSGSGGATAVAAVVAVEVREKVMIFCVKRS